MLQESENEEMDTLAIEMNSWVDCGKSLKGFHKPGGGGTDYPKSAEGCLRSWQWAGPDFFELQPGCLFAALTKAGAFTGST